MNDIKFSVAISVYKNDVPEYFKIAIDSILNQTIIPNEVVLVVDGPIPETLNSVVKIYEANEIFKVIRLAENGGLGNALKICLDNCSNELVARMDSDDVSVNDRFEQQLQYFKDNPNLDIVGGNISEFVGEENNIVAYRNVPITDGDIREYIKKRCPFNHVSVMYKKSTVQKAGGYLDLFWNEDYYLWIRMLECGCQFANTGTVLVNVRTGADMYKRRGGKKYFQSELLLQNYMYSKKIISLFTYMTNVVKRFIVQCLLPNNLRGWVFRKFVRK